MLSRFLLSHDLFSSSQLEPRASSSAPPTAPNQIVVDATNVLSQSVAMPSGLPQKMLADAQGIAIVPNMVRGAFVIGVQHGRGVLLVRGPGGAWQAPRMIEITGGSLGYQIGVQSTDLILVFRTPQSVANVMRGTLKVGVDASAAAGPVGRQASAATDLAAAGGDSVLFAARGAFVGASIDGSSISLDTATDAMYYQPPGTIPASATQLVQLLATLSSGGPADGTRRTGRLRPSCRRPVPQAASDARNRTATTRRCLAATRGQSRRPWKQYLALPAEVYIPNHTPNIEEIEQAINAMKPSPGNRSTRQLTNQPAFQATLKGLWRLGELQQVAEQKLRLPAPPIGSN